MGRLTDYTHLQTYKELPTAWISAPVSFALLSAADHWDIYGYFCGAHKLSETCLLTYRQEVSKIDPSLPQRAARRLMPGA